MIKQITKIGFSGERLSKLHSVSVYVSNGEASPRACAIFVSSPLSNLFSLFPTTLFHLTFFWEK